MTPPPARPTLARAGFFLQDRVPSAHQLARTIAGLSVILFMVLSLRLVDIGASDLGVVGLFSTDEQLAAALVRSMLQHGNLGLSHFFSYGPLDLYAARVLLWPYSLVHPVGDEAFVVALRLVSVIAGAGSLIVTFLLGERLWNAWTGALAVALLVSSQTVLAWSTTAHPDLLQLLWLMLGLFLATMVAERHSRTRILLASACAALAFATKYTGELLLPVIWFASVLRLVQEHPNPSPAELKAAARVLLLDAGLSCAAFAACFLILDPSVLREPREFVYQATLEARLAHQGHLFQLDASGVGWLQSLSESEVLGPLGLITSLAGLLAWTASDARAVLTGSGPSRSAQAIAAASRRLPAEIWSLGYLGFLAVWIADRQPRYLLPVLPVLALLSAASLVWLARWSSPGAVLATVLAVLLLTAPALSLLSYERAAAARMNDPLIQERIAAGLWLAARYPPDTRILADAYAYLPSRFPNVQQTFGLTPLQIQSDRPRIIVTDSSIRDRFLDPSAAGRYADGADAYRAIASTYAALASGLVACFPPLDQFGPEAIYGLPADGAAVGC